MMRVEDPSAYCKMMASILPKVKAARSPNLDDNALDRIDEFLMGLHQQIIEGREVQTLLVPPGGATN
jgi:hypothetical protein